MNGTGNRSCHTHKIPIDPSYKLHIACKHSNFATTMQFFTNLFRYGGNFAVDNMGD